MSLFHNHQSMADHQKIHPVVHDPEAPETPPQTPPQTLSAPLVPPGAAKSDRGAPAPAEYPPFGRTIPVTHSRPPKRRSCWCKCFCWTISLLIFLILVLGILAAIIYFVFKPKIPKYSVDDLTITQFSLNNDNTLYATFDVNITARNPNKKIGIYYESGSSISVWYVSTQLCQGSLPKFYQGHQNTTVLTVALTGQTQDAANLLQSLQAQQQTGSIPLRMRATVPVRIKLGSLKLTKWKFLVRCNLVVDSLDANDVISIKSSTCKFRFRF
ncbi:NDR1/HIN1-like protein 6 [Rhododendron vialii]|uniref:NDR1/HIN1-like protein 6 n=1 Tax=Rhododendron vialii TaxID=182163 RepID=UPI00266028BF|nr:NDR1/HIN1-like protein 6 [Rhododendron vialii]